MKAPLLALAIRTAAGFAVWPGLADSSPAQVEASPSSEIRPAKEQAEIRPDQIVAQSDIITPSVRIVVEKPAAPDERQAAGPDVVRPAPVFTAEPRLVWRERITPGFILSKWSELWLTEKCDSGVILVKYDF